MTRIRLLRLPIFLRSAAALFLGSLGLTAGAFGGRLPYSDFVRKFHSLATTTTGPATAFVHTYVLPNEVNPERAWPILTRAQHGAYVTVGTERAFIAAAMDGNADYLFVLDRDPGVIRYNEVNVALLQGSYSPGASPSEMRKKYLDLRLRGSEADWQEALSGRYSADRIRELHDWWSSEIRSSNSRILKVFESPPLDREGAAFHGANYLYDDELFAKVQTMARTDRIQSIVCDLGDSATFRRFSDLLAEAEIPASVVDISNAWYEQYLGPERFSGILRDLEERGVLTSESIVLLTDHHRRVSFYSNGEPKRRPLVVTAASFEAGGYHEEYDWSYHGYRKGFLKSRSKSGALEIPKRIRIGSSSFDDVPTVEGSPKSGNWCLRFLRSIGGALNPASP